MGRYIVLLLIIGTVWAQTGFDKLVLKYGTKYLGEYLRTEGDFVNFKHKEGFLVYQNLIIFTLKLKDGRVLLEYGIVTKQTTLKSEQSNNYSPNKKQFSLKHKLFMMQKRKL